MSSRIIKSVADLPKVCEHINLPVQSGDDDVLQRMRRPYTTAEYRNIISEIRDTIPDVTISTDIIVGFPGETEAQYENTLQLVDELRFRQGPRRGLFHPPRHHRRARHGR